MRASAAAILLLALFLRAAAVDAAGPAVPVAAGAAVGVIVTAEVLVGLSGPRASDPSTLDDFVARVGRMQRAGKSNGEIAQYVSEVADRRLTSTNKPSEGGLAQYVHTVSQYTGRATPALTRFSQTLERWDRERNDFGIDRQRQVARSEATERAEWAWRLRMGNCGEAQAVTFTVLREAGIPVRMVNSSAGAGHAYTVMGVDPNDRKFDPNDPKTWPPGARVVDGWTGRALDAREARESRHHGAGGNATVTDVTRGFFQDDAEKQYEDLAGRGNLHVFVERSSGGRVAGAHIVAIGEGAGNSVASTDADGTVFLAGIPATSYVVEASPPRGSGLGEGTASVVLSERAIARVTVVLPPGKDSDEAQSGSHMGCSSDTDWNRCRSNPRECACRTFGDCGGESCSREVAESRERAAQLSSREVWEGRWTGPSRYTVAAEGQRPVSGNEEMELLVERQGDELTITRTNNPAARNLRMTVRIDPEDPHKAEGEGDQVNDAGAPVVTTTVHYRVAASLHGGRMEIQMRTEATTIMRLPDQPERTSRATADATSTLSRLP